MLGVRFVRACHLALAGIPVMVATSAATALDPDSNSAETDAASVSSIIADGASRFREGFNNNKSTTYGHVSKALVGGGRTKCVFSKLRMFKGNSQLKKKSTSFMGSTSPTPTYINTFFKNQGFYQRHYVNLRTETRVLFFEETLFFFNNSLYVSKWNRESIFINLN